MVITCSKGVLLPTVRQPITKLQLTKNFGYHQGLLSAFLSHNTRKITRYDLLWWLDFALFDKLLFQNYLQRSIWNRLFTHQIIWANVCIFFFFFARQILIWIHSLVRLILKLHKFNLDHPGHDFFFFATENPARSESPSSVSRENNFVKKEITRRK